MAAPGDGETRDLLGSRLSALVATFVPVAADGPALDFESLTPEASTRHYHRAFTGGEPPSVVVMELPPEARGESEARFPFLNVQRYLSAAGYPVPKVYRAELGRGLIALEDLGDETLERVMKRGGLGLPSTEQAALYRRAVDLIVQLQEIGASRPDPECVAFGRRFDEALLYWEIDHFRAWLLEADRGVVFGERERSVVDASFSAISHTLAAAPPVLTHRDFQSRNIMVINDLGLSLRVIDFQDAMWGPAVYDLVALLRDSYVTLPRGMVVELLGYYAERAGVRDLAGLAELFDRQTVQRKLKDAGRFVQIHRARGNPAFLPSIPASLEYVREALARLQDLEPLREVLARHVPELRD